MSDDLADRLLETFAAYRDAEGKADKVFLDYKLMLVGEGPVHRAQRLAREARQAHLDVIAMVRSATEGQS